ncbi:MAG: polysaccharide ABC transporter ATP-binding protein [Flavobacterium sp.]|jgi:lipopolysaccharide transport system ATP-binding protein|uniref:ABC transporter ATP-binding protein n=1 Tax=Flavobacterium sp. TaxID=239 RepID=UPI003D0F0D2C
MKDIILKAENISKQYRLGQVGTGTLKHDFNRWWHKIRGKENPYLRIGDVNDRSTKGTSDYVWALQNINFEVERGEVLGIIGKNGAGKSTLLKILSKVTAPTTGSIKSRGRIASLLEVGTGFNGEMTGRENIFLNGAILGMTKKEIISKLDEIIEFSGCERYIDTPVKRYSSGMTVRLAFAVAAFLEPEILVVDEVLAVGDAEFQKKAIGKMQEISKGEGRTVLFVSHDLAAIKALCAKTILLKNGSIQMIADTDQIIDLYLKDNSTEELKVQKRTGKIITDIIMPEISEIISDKLFSFSVCFDHTKLKLASLGYLIKDEVGRAILAANMHQYGQSLKIDREQNQIKVMIDKLPLAPGQYSLSLYLSNGAYDVEIIEDAVLFNVFWENDKIIAPKKVWGATYVETEWIY